MAIQKKTHLMHTETDDLLPVLFNGTEAWERLNNDVVVLRGFVIKSIMQGHRPSASWRFFPFG